MSALLTNTLVLKLVLTPALIATASLAGRRWGPAVSGWLVGLPFTSGPVAFFLALSHGAAFAAPVAAATLAGTASQAAFCLVYAWLCLRHTWTAALFLGCLTFAVCTLALQPLVPPLPFAFLGVIAVLLVALGMMPRFGAPSALPHLPPWDIPARMVVATAFVLVLTGVAPVLGTRFTGLLAPFPLYASVLTVFAHHLQGSPAAIGVLRGLLHGLFGFATFFLTLAVLLPPAGIALAFASAIVAALAVQLISLWIIRYSALA